MSQETWVWEQYALWAQGPEAAAQDVQDGSWPKPFPEWKLSTWEMGLGVGKLKPNMPFATFQRLFNRSLAKQKEALEAAEAYNASMEA